MKKVLLLTLLMVLILTGCAKKSNPLANSVAIPVKSDYTLIPIYTLDGRNMYLNASVTPMMFFSVNCPHCVTDLPEVDKMLQEIKPQRPLVYVATFFKSGDLSEDIKEVKDFISKNKINGTVVIQAGEPTAFVKSVPSLVQLEKGKTEPSIIEGKPSKEQLQQALSLKKS